MSSVSLSQLSANTSDDAATQACLQFVRLLRRNADVQLAEHQGGCSVTMIIERSAQKTTILQLRPLQFAVDCGLMQQARSVHGTLVPLILEVKQQVIDGKVYQLLEMTAVPGICYNNLQPQHLHLDPESFNRVGCLMEGLANVFACSWHQSGLSQTAEGRIGRSLRHRLQKLSQGLPDLRLRQIARQSLLAVEDGVLERQPIVLTHGDLLPSNLLVSECDHKLTGLVDWAEAENLPFGLALYGLEHLLGFMSTVDDTPHFTYYACSELLRQTFWRHLTQQIPILSDGTILQAVMLARVVGILLWHGYAWSDGKIDRIVNTQDDAEEVAFLRAFLQAGPLSML